MSKAKITKAFNYAVGGTRVVEVAAGTYEIGKAFVEGETITARMAECAVEMGCCAAPKGGKAGGGEQLDLGDAKPAGKGKAKGKAGEADTGEAGEGAGDAGEGGQADDGGDAGDADNPQAEA